MDELRQLLANNRDWAERIRASDPAFFSRLAKQQTPRFLWIGCSDSRVPANQITGLQPGEVFVHRNVANLVPGEDLNSHSVIQYAVDALGVRHVIVCGHYGCGGVLASLRGERVGLVDYWLSSVHALRDRHASELAALPDETSRHARLCELNVVEQVGKLSRTLVVRRAWEQGRPLFLHGWIYDVADGLLRDLGVTVDAPPAGGD
ncbi:MAG: carbonic anhydrase [Gammaproteobacteria bacterium]|nr:MAG: carbonic anhydrase [Gammaproteobacteria bacterium]